MKRELDSVSRMIEERTPHGSYDYLRAKDVITWMVREALRRFGRPLTIDEQAQRLGIAITAPANRHPAVQGKEMLPDFSADERKKFMLGNLPADLIQSGFISLTNTHLSEALPGATAQRIMGVTMQAVQASPDIGLDKVIDEVVAAGVLPADAPAENVVLMDSVISISHHLASQHFSAVSDVHVNTQAA